MTKSLRSDPRRIRAARRAKLPVVRSRRPSPGRHHPASAADIREALRRFGEGAYYGVVAIELMPAPVTSKHIPLGELIGPGQIVLYDQPLPPWRLGFDLPADERSRLRAAGAVTDREGIVAWPGSTLRRFMLAHVLAHELGRMGAPLIQLPIGNLKLVELDRRMVWMTRCAVSQQSRQVHYYHSLARQASLPVGTPWPGDNSKGP